MVKLMYDATTLSAVNVCADSAKVNAPFWLALLSAEANMLNATTGLDMSGAPSVASSSALGGGPVVGGLVSFLTTFRDAMGVVVFFC